ncbi:hypothetical protein HYR99_12935 [Candidatus Poribacteria bacterium]|nr:hypothetical protein [Candidatus Poribacteria bacterium]
MSTQKSYEKGYAAGREWRREAEKHPIAVALDPFYPNVPHKPGDTAHNEGVKQGLRDEKRKK